MSPEVKFCSRQLNPSINLTKYTSAPHNPIRPILIMKTLTPPRHSYQVHRLPVAALAAAALVNSTATTSQAERAASRLDLESACQAALFPSKPLPVKSAESIPFRAREATTITATFYMPTRTGAVSSGAAHVVVQGVRED